MSNLAPLSETPGHVPSAHRPSKSALSLESRYQHGSSSLSSRLDHNGYDRSKTPERLRRHSPLNDLASAGSGDRSRASRSPSASNSRHSGGFLLEPSANYALSRRSANSSTSTAANTDGRPASQNHSETSGQERLSQDQLRKSTSQELDETSGGSKRGSRFFGRAREGLRIRKKRVSEPVQRFQTYLGRYQSTDEQEDVAKSETMSKAATMRSASASAIDPNQLVRMALSLNESRRLHLSPGHLAAAPLVGDARRVASGGSASGNQNLPTTGEGLAQYLPSSRHSSNLIERRPTPTSNGRVSSATDHSNSLPLLGLDHEHHFSIGTLSRAEKARNVIELSYEYKRLLEFLPPLHPSSGARDQATKFSTSPSTHARKGFHSADDLGRPYNPLQYIRNKRVRRDKRVPLNGVTDGWDNIHTVKSWIDSVSLESQRPNYTVEDVAFLPLWSSPAVQASLQDQQSTFTTTNFPTKPIPNKVDWSFNPADLLADAYWLEQEDHKTFIEARDGHKVFEHFHRPRAPNTRSASVESTQVPGLPPDSPLQEQTSPLSPVHPASPQSPRNIESDEDHVGFVPTHRHIDSQSKVSRLTHRLFHRSRGNSIASSNISLSDDEHTRFPQRKRRRSTLENVGPLKRHMDKMMEKESRETDRRFFDSPPHSPVLANHGRRMALHFGESSVGGKPQGLQHSRTASYESSAHSQSPTFENGLSNAPRLSVEDPDGTIRPALAPRSTIDSLITASPEDGDLEIPQRRPRPHRLGFLPRRKSKVQNNIEVTDFAAVSVSQNEAQGAGLEDGRHGRSRLNGPLRSGSYSSLSNLESTRSHTRSFSHNHLASLADANENGERTIAKRFFKGGRIGEFVRTEKPRVGDIVWKRQPPRNGSVASLASVTESSEDEQLQKPGRSSPQKASKGSTSGTIRSSGRSHSALDLTKYHHKNLPSFTPPSQGKRSNADLFRTMSKANQKSLAQAPDGTRQTDRQIQVLGEDSSEVSPNTSSHNLLDPNLFHDSLTEDRRGSCGFPQSHSARSSSRSTAHSESKAARDKDLIMEHLKAGSATLNSETASAGHRSWSIANDLGYPANHKRPSTVMPQEIAYVRSLLLSSGVKANAIVTRANTVPVRDFDLLVRAAATCKLAVPTDIVRQRQHVVAARMLSKNLDSTVQGCEETAQQFRNETAARLQARIDDLRERLNSKLTPLVRSSGDEADAFVARLTTTHTLAIKQVNDAVDQMIRNRQRRLRWLRQAGFRLLELLLVGVMWWIWLFVWIFHVFRSAVVGVMRFVKWVIWS